MWQDEDYERKWCMECAGGDGCQAGDRFVITRCFEPEEQFENQKFHFVYQTGQETQIQIPGSSLCLEAPEGDAVHLFFTLLTCMEGKLEQQFGPGQGNFDADRFELTMFDGTCATHPHHPQELEQLWKEICSTAREHTTSFWNKY